MPEWMRPIYEISGLPSVQPPDEALLEHRDFVFDEYLGLPQDF